MTPLERSAMSHPPILLALVLVATPARAVQSPVPEPPLTADMVRKVSAIMKEWNPVPTMGSRLVGGTGGMPKEKFAALPDSAKQRIMAEEMGKAEAKQKEGEKQLSALMKGSLADRVAAINKIPALSAALSKAGMSPGDFIPPYVSYYRAMAYLLSEEGFPEGTKPLPAGVRKDNTDLMRPMLRSREIWNPIG
jgi:hypothetical protein